METAPTPPIFSINYDFKTYAEAHNPAAGGCGPSAQKAQNSFIRGPNSEEIGPPRGAELGAGGAALRAAPPGPRTESWGCRFLWSSGMG
eukprot:4238345-Alexandrium_andersonii.AAC.1